MFARTILALILIASSAFAQPIGPTAAWPLDELTHTNGAQFRGAILDDSPVGVRFRVVQRPFGRPTVTFTTYFSRKEVAGLKRITDAQRVTLKERLAELDANGTGERKRMDDLTLLPAAWLGKDGAAKRYDSERFILISSAPDEVTRRAVVRLEQIGTAYSRFLPPLSKVVRPTTVFLATDRTEFQALLGPGVGTILNPAVFEPATNRIICGSDLRQLGTDMTAARLHNVQQLATVEKYETEIKTLYKEGRERDRFLLAVADQRKKVLATERANDAGFDAATAKLFAILYHESFHAYAANSVYPPLSIDDVKAGKGTGELPRWLNEGLAQIFETAVLDGSELRVGHADRDRLKPILERKAKGELVPVADLLRAGKDTFVAAHADQRTLADRAYLTAWGLAFYLTFERQLIGTPAFAKYLTSINSGGDPLAAFEALVGQNTQTFQSEWHQYLARLHPNGTAPAGK